MHSIVFVYAPNSTELVQTQIMPIFSSISRPCDILPIVSPTVNLYFDCLLLFGTRYCHNVVLNQEFILHFLFTSNCMLDGFIFAVIQ